MSGFSTISLEPHFHVRGYLRLADAANIDQADIRTNVEGGTQLLVGRAPVPSEPWSLRARFGSVRQAVTNRFVAVRPVDPSHPLLYYWALLNSPFANAFAYCHSGERDSLAGMIRELPLPRYAPDGAGTIAHLAAQYRSIAKSSGPLPSADWLTEARAALLRMDAAVLRLYDLPPRAERDLLQLFAGRQRPGVPFPFTRYYEEGFRPAIPLALYISDEYSRATAAALSARFKPAPASVLRALGEDDE